MPDNPYQSPPIAELYANRIADAWERRVVPAGICKFVRSPYFCALLFWLGTLGSMLRTLIIGLSVALTIGP